METKHKLLLFKLLKNKDLKVWYIFSFGFGQKWRLHLKILVIPCKGIWIQWEHHFEIKESSMDSINLCATYTMTLHQEYIQGSKRLDLNVRLF